jgi:hypothetical protein
VSGNQQQIARLGVSYSAVASRAKESTVNVFTKLPLLALALVLPTASFAQSGDATYCTALSNKYERYVSSNDRNHRQTTPPNNVSVAMSKCQSASAEAIPVLEKALQSAKLDLPPRG